MHLRFLAVVLALALFAAACGSDPETVVVGDSGSEAADDSDTSAGVTDIAADGASVVNPPVAEDSAPRLSLEPCEIVGSGGPLDPADVLIDVAGGRWGDDVMTVDSGSDEFGIQPEALDLEPCSPEKLIEDCTGFFAFFEELAEEFRATGRDDDRDHELDNYAGDVGDDAEAYVDAFDEWVATCPTIDFEGDLAQLVDLELDQASAAEFTIDFQRVWIAALARENVFTLLAVQQTGRDSLVDEDLADFERLIEILRTRLETAPLS